MAARARVAGTGSSPFAPAEHLRGARDQHPDVGRQPGPGRRATPETRPREGRARPARAPLPPRRAADSSARRKSLATDTAGGGRNLTQMRRRFDAVDKTQVVVSTIPGADVAAGDRPLEIGRQIGTTVASENDLVASADMSTTVPSRPANARRESDSAAFPRLQRSRRPPARTTSNSPWNAGRSSATRSTLTIADRWMRTNLVDRVSARRPRWCADQDRGARGADLDVVAGSLQRLHVVHAHGVDAARRIHEEAAQRLVAANGVDERVEPRRIVGAAGERRGARSALRSRPRSNGLSR